MKLPQPRGPVSAALAAALELAPHHLDPALGDELAAPGADRTALLDDEDLQLTLFMLYELAYRGWDGVDDRWEWHPDLLRLRGAAEDRLEAALQALAAPYRDTV